MDDKTSVQKPYGTPVYFYLEGDDVPVYGLFAGQRDSGFLEIITIDNRVTREIFARTLLSAEQVVFYELPVSPK